MNSIRKKLVRTISIAISLIMVSILLVTDLSVDGWIDAEFNRSLTNKAHLLITLVSEDPEEVEFDFADEFMPEFSGRSDPEYFQLWLADTVFERSQTLELFDTHNLPKPDIPLNTSIIKNIVLPDGRTGRMIVVHFMPQIDTDIHEEFDIDINHFMAQQQPMYLAYAATTERINQILWLVDILFLITAIVTVGVLAFVIKKIVAHGLKPLNELNRTLSEVDISSGNGDISLINPPRELIPMINGLNRFIQQNQQLYAREKRLTSDIAHELKTPVTELINLAEVAIKFPANSEISQSFKPDVLSIATRMKNIVSSILVLHKGNYTKPDDTAPVDYIELITRLTQRIDKTFDIQSGPPNMPSKVNSDKVGLEVILSNLFNNAAFYSPDDKPVKIEFSGSEPHRLIIDINNELLSPIDKSDLAHFFEPLWQKDPSRTSTEHFGLGLTIVKSYCDAMGASIEVSLPSDTTINFKLSLPNSGAC